MDLEVVCRACLDKEFVGVVVDAVDWVYDVHSVSSYVILCSGWLGPLGLGWGGCHLLKLIRA